MTTTEPLERALADDLLQVHERFADEKFCGALYRTLANNKLSKPGAGEGHVTLSFKQAESLVNQLRGRLGRDDLGNLTLAQTGGEGEVDRTAADELEARGWGIGPASTSDHHDPFHGAADASAPPDGAGGREDSGRWAAEGHAAADETLRRRGKI